MWAVRLRGAVLSAKFWPVCILAFLLPRVLLIWCVPVEPTSDFLWYFNRAKELAESGVYQEGGAPTAFWPIGYPAFLAALFLVAGPSILAAQLVNLLLGGVALWLVYKLSKELFNNEVAARLAVLLLAVYPNHIGYTALLASEPLYCTLLLFACYCLLRPPKAGVLIGGGVAIGLATLVKSQTALLAAMLVVCTLLWAGNRSERWRRLFSGALMGAIALALVIPWTIRNYLTFGTPIFVSTNGGISLLMGNNPSMKGRWGNDFAAEDPLVAAAHFSAADQVAADRRSAALAYQWIADNPLEFISLMPQKAWRLWAPDGEAEWGFQGGTPWYEQYAGWFRAVRGANQAFYFATLLLAALALWRLVVSKAGGRTYIGYSIAVFFTILSLVFSGQSRYHFPVMPFLFIYAGWFLQDRWLRESR